MEARIAALEARLGEVENNEKCHTIERLKMELERERDQVKNLMDMVQTLIKQQGKVNTYKPEAPHARESQQQKGGDGDDTSSSLLSTSLISEETKEESLKVREHSLATHSLSDITNNAPSYPPGKAKDRIQASSVHIHHSEPPKPPKPPSPGREYRQQVVISHQTEMRPLLLRIVGALNKAGIRTVDGTRVPPGEDWRRFFFPALSKAKV